MLDHENKLCHVANKSERSWQKNGEWMSVDQLGLYCTFVPLRSHPQPQHYAPTTGLDPSPLQDFSLLIRSLLVSGAPGSRTFKPCLGRFGALFFELQEKKLVQELKHFGKQQKVHPKALRSCRAPQENWAFTELWKMNDWRCVMFQKASQ